MSNTYRYALNKKTQRKQRDYTLDLVANYLELAHEDITGRSRKAHLVYARHLVMYLLYEQYGWSFPLLGEWFALDQSTCRHAFLRIHEERKRMKIVREDVTALTQMYHPTLQEL